MKHQSPIRPLKQRLFEIQSIFFLVLLCIFLASMQRISKTFNEMIMLESADKLSLYTVNLERALKDIEQCSYNILSSYSVQNDLRTYLSQPGTYEAYSAVKALETSLFSATTNRSSIASVHFIFTDGYRVTGAAGYPTKIDDEFIALIQQKTTEAQNAGNSVWLINPKDPKTIVFARIIRSIYPGDYFSEYGVLIFCLNSEGLLYFPQSTSRFYNAKLLCYVSGSLYDAQNPEYTDVLMQAKKEFEANLQERFYYKQIDSAVFGWSFLYLLDFNPLHNHVASMRNNYMTFLCLSVFFVLFLLNRVSLFICKPLAAITQHMTRTKEGNFDTFPSAQEMKITEIRTLSETYNAMIEKINYLITEVYNKQLVISEIKYQMLQKQINPHFLYNTLETIRWKAVTDNDNDLADMALALSSLLRSSIKKPDIITLQEELQLVNDYITIQKIRFEDRLTFAMEEPNTFSCLYLPKMTIQPLIENSIRHNLEKYAGVCSIRVLFQKEANCLRIIVEDNGTHADTKAINAIISGKQSPDKKSFGLQNIQYRLQICFTPSVDAHDKTDGIQNEIAAGLHAEPIFENGSTLVCGTRMYITLPDRKNIAFPSYMEQTL